MPNSKHTPGPLTVVRANRPNGPERSMDCGILDTENHVIAECFEIVGPGITRPAFSNAQLFAAAQDLLEACRAAKQLLINDLQEPGRTVFWKCVAAISKAEGEAQ